jgi:hypothetical protein
LPVVAAKPIDREQAGGPACRVSELPWRIRDGVMSLAGDDISLL